MKKTICFILAICALSFSYAAQKEVNIIPKPNKISVTEGVFKINKKTQIFINSAEARETADFLSEILVQSSRRVVEITEAEATKGSISLVLNNSTSETLDESYTLNVTQSNIEIAANSTAGLFYGVQSLRQLLPASIESKNIEKSNTNIEIPCLTIEDAPRFAWRGYMKDVSRTFYSIDVIKKYLDVMALYKINVFHFHLTDDQGWRIEMKKYPELTSELTTTFDEQYNQPESRSGYYTQEQIKEIVQYAADRHITVVPEIDVPGHSWPTLLVYPELGVNDNHSPFYVFPFCSAWDVWGNQFTPNSLDPTKEAVYEFLDNVFTEIAELFPSEYIHFGGDEVVHKFWEAESHVQEFCKANGIADMHKLQSYFVERVTKIIMSKNRKPIGWNDILADSELTKSSAIMCWLGENAIVKAVNNGYYAVATPSKPLYFDITQADRNDGTMCDLNYQVINSLEAVYNYNPTQGVDADKLEYVLGVQANMWPAVPQELKDVNVQNFPRLLGLAEIAWASQDDKDFEEFSARIEKNKERLDYLKVDYYREGGYIAATWTPQDVTTKEQTLEWDMTSKVYASGRVMAGFYGTAGKDNLEVLSVELLENGKVISTDDHTSESVIKKNIFRPYNYYLEVKDYNNKATYTLRATVKAKGEGDTSGNVIFNLGPYEPFSVIEPK